MLTGFSPRKQQISLYIMAGVNQYKDLLNDLGKYKLSSGSCLYIQTLADIRIPVLKKLIKQSFDDMNKKYNKK